MDELIAIKDRAWEKFCTLPGVHAVGIGKKVRGGVRTEETVLTVFVARKLPLDELRGDAVPSVFEGVRTDILARPIPRTLDALPLAIQEAAIPAGKKFTFTTPDPPPKGIRIVLTVALHLGGGADLNLIREISSDGHTSIYTLLDSLRFPESDHFIFCTVEKNVLTLRPADILNHSVDATCYALPIDYGLYAHEYLRGGICIQGGGTMGCLARTGPTPEHPQGRIVGVTCAHVVRSPISEFGALNAIAPDKTKIELRLAMDSANELRPIEAHSVIFLAFMRDDLVGVAFYPTSANESLASVTNGLIKAINDAKIETITAAIDVVMLTRARINIQGFSGSNARIDCRVEAKMVYPVGLQLQVRVETAASGDHLVNFSGNVNSAELGVFVDIFGDGASESFGIYLNPPRDQTIKDLAQSVSTAINELPIAQNGLVSAIAIGGGVTIRKAKDVRVWLQPEIRIGHPTNTFATPRQLCCNFRIGRVVDVRPGLDVALVQLDAGLRYKHHIQEINAVVGTQTPFVDLEVQKRGIATGVTKGVVKTIAVSGYVAVGNALRIFRNVAVIESTMFDAGGKTLREFSGHGDSGSAVVTQGPGSQRVVGILFAGDAFGSTWMTPVQDIVSGFSQIGLSFDLAPAIDPDAVQTVPAPASGFQALDAFAAPPLAAFGERMLEAEQEIAATPLGREYAEFVRRNLSEAFDLVNRNRRVATVWHRSGGPELLNAALRALRFDDEPLPREINGRPLAECIERLKQILLRYASPGFASDIARMAARYSDFAGMNFRQVLTALRNGIPE